MEVNLENTLLNENLWIPLNNYNINNNGMNLDIYKALKNKGFLNESYKLQFFSILKKTFFEIMKNIKKYDILISNNLLFNNICNRTNYNYEIQFIRKTFLKLFTNFIPIDKRQSIDKQFIDKLDKYTPEYIETYKYIFDYLSYLESPETILWFFFQTPLYINFDIDNYRKIFNLMLDYSYDNWKEKNFFKNNKEKNTSYEFRNNKNTFYYFLAYHGKSNSELISKWCKLQKKIYPDLNYISCYLRIKDRPIINKNYIDLDLNLLDEENKIKLDMTDNKTIQNYILNNKCKFFFRKDAKLEILLIKFLESRNNKITLKNIQSDVSKNKILAKLSNKISSKIKICFISNKLLSLNSVFRDRIGLITNLNENFFDVYIGIFKDEKSFKINNYNNTVQSYINKFYLNNKIIFLSNDLQYNQNKISNEKFHIIYYPDIGMIYEQTMLSYAKLAPIQITTWGHSDTSGNCSIDYFISSKYFEDIDNIETIKNNYYETPILMNSLSTYYYSPKKLCRSTVNEFFEKEFKPKEKYGFKEDDILIGCLQSFFKIYEPFEEIIKEILENTQNNVYILFCNSFPFNKFHLLRLQEKMKHNIDRIKFYQNKNMIEWMNLINICNFMIDPYPFGGCNTSLEAFDFDIPVVCLPSHLINGKFTEGFYKYMGIEHCIAESPKEYYNIVKRLIRDKEFYDNMKLSINKNKHKLFEQKNVITEYEELFVKLIDKHYLKN